MHLFCQVYMYMCTFEWHSRPEMAEIQLNHNLWNPLQFDNNVTGKESLSAIVPFTKLPCFISMPKWVILSNQSCSASAALILQRSELFVQQTESINLSSHFIHTDRKCSALTAALIAWFRKLEQRKKSQKMSAPDWDVWGSLTLIYWLKHHRPRQTIKTPQKSKKNIKSICI